MENKKRVRSYNKHFNKKKVKQLTLEKGMTGFLCTYQFKEKECIKDAYKLLEKFDNDHQTSVNNANPVNIANEPSNDKQSSDAKAMINSNDILCDLNEEIKDINNHSKNSMLTSKFQYIDVGVKNIIFIKSTVADPSELALSIFQTVAETQTPMTRFLLRLIPIQLICKADINDIKAQATILFNKYFVREPVTFAIIFKRRYNNSIQRNEVIENLASIIMEKNSGNKANLKNPDIAVIVEIVKNFCLLSIAPEYFKYKKYNLFEICNKKDVIIQKDD